MYWRQAGVVDSKSCGSAMGVAPIGLFYEDLGQVADVARASSLLTHGHSAAVEGAAAAALMVALALRGKPPEAIFDAVGEQCATRSDDFAAAWSKVPSTIAFAPEEVLVAGALGEGWVAEEAVASAMYCFWRFPDNYRSAVLTAINTDGDSDTIGTVTGSVLGARLGVDAIPTGWRHGVENAEYLNNLGSRLWVGRERNA